MTRNMSTLLTLAAFVLFSTSCKTWGTSDVRMMPRPLPENTAVLSVVLNSGRVLKFSESEPGRVLGYSLVGTARDSVAKQVDIAGPFSYTRDRTGLITGVVDGQGQAYVVQKIFSGDDRKMTLVAWTLNEVSIPLTEISTVKIRKTNAFLTTLVVLGGLGIAIVVYGIYLLNRE